MVADSPPSSKFFADLQPCPVAADPSASALNSCYDSAYSCRHAPSGFSTLGDVASTGHPTAPAPPGSPPRAHITLRVPRERPPAHARPDPGSAPAHRQMHHIPGHRALGAAPARSP
ncbi:hypothetical protein VTO73DRAFT_11312 [Trametes versicolor]